MNSGANVERIRERWAKVHGIVINCDGDVYVEEQGAGLASRAGSVDLGLDLELLLTCAPMDVQCLLARCDDLEKENASLRAFISWNATNGGEKS